MKTLARISGLILVMVMAIQINIVYAERKVIDNVPYIHQVQDMDQSKFLGHNSCGPTSACMIARFHYVQPIASHLYGNGWYVWNSYIGTYDKLGQNYDGYNNNGGYEASEWAMDMDKDENHKHSVCGAHGFIIVNDPQKDYWGTDYVKLRNYLYNHGLTVSETQIWSSRFEIIKQNVNAGLPLIGHVDCGANCGHYLVIIGYDTGSNGNEQKVVVNDPYGDYNDFWDGSLLADGESVTYPLNGVAGSWTVNINWVYTIHPVGIYNWFTGWRKSGLTQTSQPFVDCYNKDRDGKSGKDVFGIPYDNGKGSWVHKFPDEENSGNTVFLQDFIDWDDNDHWWQLILNQEMSEVFPVHGQILTFWHNNFGYLNYGEPICDEYSITNSSGHLSVEQKFQKNEIIRIIGYDTVNGVAYTKIYISSNSSEPESTTPSSNGSTSSSQEIIYNQVLGTTAEGFTIMAHINTWKPFPGGNYDLATALKYVNAGQNPADIIYNSNTGDYSLKPDAIPVIIYITMYKGICNCKKVSEGNVDMYELWGWSTIQPDIQIPTGLTAEINSQLQIDLTWDVSDADGYKLYRNSEIIATLENTVYSDTGLIANTSYCYKIKAYCENKDSDYSEEVCKTFPLAPASNFTATPTSGEVPLTVKFNNTSYGEVISYLWDFDNGQTRKEQNPEYIYVKSGTYYANLTVANYGGSSSKTIKITVKPQPPPPLPPLESGIPEAPNLWME